MFYVYSKAIEVAVHVSYKEFKNKLLVLEPT